MVRRSLADDSYGRASLPRAIELRKVNALPCPKRDLAVAHRKRDRVTDKDRLHVRRTVSFGMRVLRIARHGAFQRHEHVFLHVGVGVLVDEHRGGGVRDADCHDPIADLRARDRSLHARRDVDGLFALLRCEADLLVPNAHASRRSLTRSAPRPGAPAPWAPAPAPPAACGSPPPTRTAGRAERTASAIPLMRPPPPTATITSSTSGRSSTISRPIVP